MGGRSNGESMGRATRIASFWRFGLGFGLALAGAAGLASAERCTGWRGATSRSAGRRARGRGRAVGRRCGLSRSAAEGAGQHEHGHGGAGAQRDREQGERARHQADIGTGPPPGLPLPGDRIRLFELRVR